MEDGGWRVEGARMVVIVVLCGVRFILYGKFCVTHKGNSDCHTTVKRQLIKDLTSQMEMSSKFKMNKNASAHLPFYEIPASGPGFLEVCCQYPLSRPDACLDVVLAGSKQYSASIAFTLALFSHLVNHVNIRLQAELEDGESQVPALQADNAGEQVTWSNSQREGSRLLHRCK